MGQAGGSKRVVVNLYQSEFLKDNYLNTIRGIYFDMGCFNFDVLVSYMLGINMVNEDYIFNQLSLCEFHPLYKILYQVLDCVLKDSIKLEYYELANNVDLLIKGLNK